MTGAKAQAIRECLLARYSGDFSRTVAIRAFLEDVCLRHFEMGLGDADLVQKLCSGDDERYWQQLSEILLGHELMAARLVLTPSHEGPDFLIEHEGRKIWIEVICPLPTGIPHEWLAQPFGKAFAYPHEAILMRWTAAIKEKGEKLLGNTNKKITGYIEKGVVGANDAYVIAVNARLLRGPHFASITGISQYPYAVEAAFSVGPLQVNIDLNTLKAAGTEHQHRPTIKKPNGALGPAYTFLDPAFQPISAIWAVDIDETWVIGNMKAMAVVHNPEATSGLPTGLLPSYHEHVAIADGLDAYKLHERPGRLAVKSASSA